MDVPETGPKRDDSHSPAQTPYTGPERRRPDVPDRRKLPRGGRRATDTMKKAAVFLHRLPTEPPR